MRGTRCHRVGNTLNDHSYAVFRRFKGRKAAGTKVTFARAASKCPITVMLSGRLTSRSLIPAISQLPIKVAGIADCNLVGAHTPTQRSQWLEWWKGKRSTTSASELPRNERNERFLESTWRVAAERGFVKLLFHFFSFILYAKIYKIYIHNQYQLCTYDTSKKNKVFLKINKKKRKEN